MRSVFEIEEKFAIKEDSVPDIEQKLLGLGFQSRFMDRLFVSYYLPSSLQGVTRLTWSQRDSLVPLSSMYEGGEFRDFYLTRKWQEQLSDGQKERREHEVKIDEITFNVLMDMAGGKEIQISRFRSLYQMKNRSYQEHPISLSNVLIQIDKVSYPKDLQGTFIEVEICIDNEAHRSMARALIMSLAKDLGLHEAAPSYYRMLTDLKKVST